MHSGEEINPGTLKENMLPTSSTIFISQCGSVGLHKMVLIMIFTSWIWLIITPATAVADRTSDNVIDINGSIHGVYIRTNLVSSGTLDSQNGTFSNILARIPIKVQSGGIIFSEPSNNIHKALVDLSVIGTLTIRLTDERNRILDLNGLHFQLGIQIDFIHKIEPKRDINAEERRIAENYGVRSDSSSGRVIQQSQIIAQQQQELEGYKKRNKVGRPRRVGRPNKTKINDWYIVLT